MDHVLQLIEHVALSNYLLLRSILNFDSLLDGTKIRFRARTAREHEALMARNKMSNHTNMQDKYCGDCYDIHPPLYIGLNRVNIVAITTILVLHVGVIGHHAPRQ